MSAAEALIAPTGSLGWGSLPASQFNYDPMEVRKAVYNFKAWAVSSPSHDLNLGDFDGLRI